MSRLRPSIRRPKFITFVYWTFVLDVRKNMFLEFQEIFRYTPKIEAFLKTLNAHNSVTVKARGVQFCVVTRALILRKKSPSRRDLFGKFNSRVYLNRAAPVLTHRRKKLVAKNYFSWNPGKKLAKPFLSGLVDLWGGRNSDIFRSGAP